jgi:hypothetical protein
MPITADIADLAPAEFLLMLSITSKTGKLSAVNKGSRVLFAIREGAIVYAAQPTIRERLGSLLINRGLITEDELIDALELQRKMNFEKLLGTILVENGALSNDDLCEVIQGQFGVVLRELLSWESGVMNFEISDMPDIGGVHVDPFEILVGLGVEVDALLAESLGKVQTSGRGVSPPKESTRSDSSTSLGVDGELGSAGTPADELAATAAAEGRSRISELVQEADSHSVSLTAEMTLAMLGSASEVAERAVLFLVYPDYLSGAGGFGQGRDGAQLTGQQLRIPHERGSVFSTVIREQGPYRGPLEDEQAHAQLFAELGGAPSGEVMVVPLIHQRQVLGLLYVDGGPDGTAMGSLNVVEATVAQVADMLEADRLVTEAVGTV